MRIYFNRYESGYILSKGKRKVDDQQYEILCNKNKDEQNLCIETWVLDNGELIDVRYDIMKFNTNKVNELRTERAKEVGGDLAYIISVKIPKERYEHIERYMAYFPK